MVEFLMVLFCLTLVWVGQTILCEGGFWVMWKLLQRDIKKGIITEDVFAHIEKMQKLAQIGIF